MVFPPPTSYEYQIGPMSLLSKDTPQPLFRLRCPRARFGSIRLRGVIQPVPPCTRIEAIVTAASFALQMSVLGQKRTPPSTGRVRIWIRIRKPTRRSLHDRRAILVF